MIRPPPGKPARAPVQAKGAAGGGAAGLRSPLLVGWFRRHAEGRLARAFRAVRLSRGGRPDPTPPGPLVVVLNHPSWWDPLVCLHLTRLFPDRAHFAPMDAAALGKYRFFRRLGFFPVETGPGGARSFLRECAGILGEPGTAVWITAQGRFADARERPAGIRPGAAHLARRLESGWVLPLALEYPFRDDARPEALARFGEPLELPAAGSVEEVRRGIEERLEAAQDALAAEALRRDPSLFATSLEGRAGMGGAYGLWLAVRDRLRGGSPGKEERP